MADITLEYVQSKFKDMVDALKGYGSTGNLDCFVRSACEPVRVEGNRIVLRFMYEFHRAKVDRYKQQIEDIWGRVLGTPCEVECVLSECVVNGKGPLTDGDMRVLVTYRHHSGSLETMTARCTHIALWTKDPQNAVVLLRADGQEPGRRAISVMAQGLIQLLGRR